MDKELQEKIIAALEAGDFKVEYQLPENVEVREVEGEGTIYIIDPMCGCECTTGGGCFNGGCTVEVCGVKIEGVNGTLGGQGHYWEYEGGDLCFDVDDGDDVEKLLDALDDNIRFFDEVGEEEVKEICCLYSGKTRDELASQFYLLGFDEIPGDDEDIIEEE